MRSATGGNNAFSMAYQWKCITTVGKSGRPAEKRSWCAAAGGERKWLLASMRAREGRESAPLTSTLLSDFHGGVCMFSQRIYAEIVRVTQRALEELHSLNAIEQITIGRGYP